MSTVAGRSRLEVLGARLRELHSHALAAASEGLPRVPALALLDRLIHDPEWAWLRPLSALIAGLDHAGPADASTEAAAAAAARGLICGDGDLADGRFLERYRPLLQRHVALASTHGEVRRLLREFPAEPANEPERLHARRQWALLSEERRRAG